MVKDSQLKLFIKDVISPKARYAMDFSIVVVIYGFLLSFSLSQIIPSRFRFNILSILAWGIAFYFIKEEFPRIILKMQQAKRPRSGGGNEDF